MTLHLKRQMCTDTLQQVHQLATWGLPKLLFFLLQGVLPMQSAIWEMIQPILVAKQNPAAIT